MKTMQKSITTEKENGRFYTPIFIVDNILDLAGYYGAKILKKHVIDNSCGDGAFLTQIVRRYCTEAISQGYSIDDLRSDLATYIHGIELEIVEQKKCIENISRVAEQFDVFEVEWNILCGDALAIKSFDGKMDYVLGNPPYVRVHNLGDSFDEIKKFSFAQNGMTDLFIVFYELGIKMLNETGTLGYITPSSYFNSIAGAYMRKYLAQEKLLTTVVDLRHFQAFDATTYTAITILKKGEENQSVDYYRFDEKNRVPYYVETVEPDDYQIAGNYYFAKKEELHLLHKILFNLGKSDVAVKNGYATLCDGVFINEFDFQSKYIIPVIKSSKGVEQRIFYPYDHKGNLILEDELQKDEKLYRYLVDNKAQLTKRSNEKDAAVYWYAFGRSQAISDTYKNKLAINSLLRSKEDFKFTEAPPGTGVYGGLYIVSDTINMKEIIAVLKTDEFISYIELLGKYKSGGYYTFSSKDVKAYLDYKFSYDGGIFSC
ncbi:MAG: N-6 DNA methylase [Eubacteriales bacterium]